MTAATARRARRRRWARHARTVAAVVALAAALAVGMWADGTDTTCRGATWASATTAAVAACRGRP